MQKFIKLFIKIEWIIADYEVLLLFVDFNLSQKTIFFDYYE